MSKIAVVFYSGTGNTETMANAVVEGARNAGSEVRVMDSGSFSADMVASYDAIAFGCPAMGVEVLEEDSFEPMFTSVEKHLAGKKVALFGSYGWGDGEWMRLWEERTKNDGALLVSDPVIANEDPDAEALKLCRDLGAALSR